MRKICIALVFLLLSFSIIVKSQTIQQVGYYSINGVFALSAKPNLMYLGNDK
ncbi:MAG: hypothetical protein WCO63_04295 [Bacteroidota bacterium]